MMARNHNLLLNRTFQYFGIILVVIAIGGGYWYWKVSQAAQTVESDTPSFEAPLTHDLNLSKGQGVATYSRADGADRRATVTDFEGLIRPVKAGEARFEGARRVENLITYSEDPTNAAWSNSLVSLATGISDPSGGTSAIRMTATGANAFISRAASPAATGRSYTHSIWVRRVSGSGSVILHGDGIGDVTVTSQVTTSWKRLSNTFTTTDGNLWAGVRLGTSGDAVDVAFAQMEEVTGQANQNPSEYVSTNVKTAFPYHGAGVDGVKYFDTQNGNTVASNVVTEATGAKIASATLKGYLAEGSRTNLALRSEEFNDAAWNSSNTVITANSLAAPDGRSTVDTITATSGQPGAHIWNTSAITVTANATATASIYVKRGNFDWIRLAVVDNTGVPNGRYQVWVNLSTGVLGTQSATGTGSITGAAVTSMSNGWFRIALTGSLGGGYTTAYMITLSATGDNSTTRVTDAQFYLWGAQLEQAAFASSYIPTTSASVTRAADSLRYPETGNFNDPAGTVSVDVITEWSGGSGFSADWVTDSTNTQKLSLWHWSGSSNHMAVDRSGGGGTRNNADYSGAAITSGTPMKLAQRWTSAGNSLFRDGSLRVSDTTLTLPYDALNNNLYIGRETANGYEAYSTIKNVRAWKKALTDTELNNLTSLTQTTSDSAVKETTVKTPSNTGLVGYWSFEDGSGTRAEDFSPTGTNTGTLTNGPTWVDGKIGKALSFDGVDDYISTTFDAPTSSFSVSALVKTNNTASADSRRAIISKRTSLSEWHFSQNTSTSKLIFDAWDASSNTTKSFSGATALQPNVWYHAVLTYDGSMASIYLNGILDGSTSSGNAMRDTSDYVRIGTEILDPDRYWSGSIDEVRLYDYALSATEIAGLYAQGSTGKTTVNASQNNQLTSGLVGLWSFNGPDLSGTTAYDRSGQGNNGALVNGPSVYPGKVGQGLSFDGSNDYVNIGNSAVYDITGAITVSAWVKVNNFKGSGSSLSDPIIGKWAYAVGNQRGYDLRFFNGETRPMFVVTDGVNYDYVQPATGILTGTWTHIVGTWSSGGGNNLQIYVNGTVTQKTNAYASLGVSPNAVHIGHNFVNEAYFNGLIDEVRIYNRALSAPEVAALYSMGR